MNKYFITYRKASGEFEVTSCIVALRSDAVALAHKHALGREVYDVTRSNATRRDFIKGM